MLSVALCALPGFGHAQQPLLHLPLDGGLNNAGTAGGTAELFTAEGATPPTFVGGHLGQALSFTDRSAVSLPFELDHARYPRVTITAWVREKPGADGGRTILTTGSTAGASLAINGGRLAMRAGSTGLTFDALLPVGEWVFVAGVLDATGRWARLHQNEGVYRREGINTDTKPPRKLRAPGDPDSEPRAWLSVGAFTLNNWQRSDRLLLIDDVRLYPEALSEAQVEAIRQAGAPAATPAEPAKSTTTQAFGLSAACESDADCAAGEYCARDLLCHPESHLPLAGGGTTLEEMQRRSAERNAGMVEGAATDSPTGALPGGAVEPQIAGASGELPDNTSAELGGPPPSQQIADPATQAVIRGTVTNDAGDRLSDVKVRVTRVANGNTITSTQTGTDGSYSIVVYATEDVYVFPEISFRIPYGGTPERRRLKLEPAKVFDADLQRVITPCTIEGTVTHTSGQRLPGIRVGIYDPDNFNMARPPPPLLSTTTDSNGQFRIEFTGIRDWEAVEPAWHYVENSSQVAFTPRLHAIDPTGATVVSRAPEVRFLDFSYGLCSNTDWSVVMRSP